MYPLHKYMPTPFGTYLLYIDNGPTKVKVDTWPSKTNQKYIPSYQRIKEEGRRLQQQANHAAKYQAFQKPFKPSTSASAAANRDNQRSTWKNDAERQKQAYSASSVMPNSIWSPKVKRKRQSYNMRYLWHTGQHVLDSPVGVVKVDEVTGAEVKPEAQWYKDRSSKKHEEIFAMSPGIQPGLEEKVERAVVSQRSEELKSRMITMEEQRSKSFPERSRKVAPKTRAPPNSVVPSREMSEAHRRRASQLRNDMVPRMQRKTRHSSRHAGDSRRSQTRRDERSQAENKETPTTPSRIVKSSMDVLESAKFPMIASEDSSNSSTPAQKRMSPTVQERMRSSRNCLQKTGLPPIMEGEGSQPEKEKIPQTVGAILDEMSKNRMRRVNEFRSASPTFPIASKPEYWEKLTMERGVRLGKTGNDSLLPFTWKDSHNRQTQPDKKDQIETLLPVVTRVPSIQRLGPWKAS